MVSVAIIRRSCWPISVLVVFAAFGFAAIKLLPKIGMLRERPRIIDALESNSVRRLMQASSRTTRIITNRLFGCARFTNMARMQVL
jgi:hypothetical protein